MWGWLSHSRIINLRTVVNSETEKNKIGTFRKSKQKEGVLTEPIGIGNVKAHLKY